jgi:hypothetical protein
LKSSSGFINTIPFTLHFSSNFLLFVFLFYYLCVSFSWFLLFVFLTIYFISIFPPLLPLPFFPSYLQGSLRKWGRQLWHHTLIFSYLTIVSHVCTRPAGGLATSLKCCTCWHDCHVCRS